MIDSATLSSVLIGETITPSFQPIVSVKDSRVVGFEALIRGKHPESGAVISPLDLFGAAKRDGLTLTLDRLCRSKALATFADTPYRDSHLLFINVDPSTIDATVFEQPDIDRVVMSRGLSPATVAIELVESRIGSEEHLTRFVEYCRSRGFLIVLDDFGVEHSNLDRIYLVKPDIIKIDRQLIRDVSRDYYHESLVGSIIDLARKFGALTLAEGVEDLDDTIRAHELGADLFQGFYFAKPTPDPAGGIASCSGILRAVSGDLSRTLELNLADRMLYQGTVQAIASRIGEQLAMVAPDNYDAFLRDCVTFYPQIECAYILDATGTQISDTVLKPGTTAPRTGFLFHPALRGADHSLKAYYYHIKHLSLPTFFTDPYISLATGSICRTLAMRSGHSAGKPLILCIDLVG